MFQLVGLDRKVLAVRMLRSEMTECTDVEKQGLNQDVPTSWTWQKGSGRQNVKIRND